METLCITFDKPETVIAFFALVTSIVSIIFIYIALRTQKEHNLKSVRPIGIISVGDYENDIFVRIDNNGIGPLIITELKVSNSKLTANDLINIIPTQIKGVVWTDFVSDVANRAIKSGDQLYLIRLTFEESDIGVVPDPSEETKEELRKFLKDIKIELTYTDIYEKNSYEVTRELTWFGRHFE